MIKGQTALQTIKTETKNFTSLQLFTTKLNNLRNHNPSENFSVASIFSL